MISSLRKLARPWAVVFILANLLNVLAPTISWALTSGPTAPEATSFEPVDTTDMVNLATGDFTYNIPLLEVPGPAGGYPLSLSYHAGIQPNEDASWVGLGWTLNPGAISRTVNGYPDDQVGATRTRHDYNHGGERNTFAVGLGVAGANLNLSISNDSNLGLGIGVSTSLGYHLGGNDDVGINASIGASSDPYGGGSSVNAGIGIQSSGGLSAGFNLDSSNGASGQIGLSGSSGAGVGISTNFQSVSGHLSFGSGTSISISSNGLKASLSVAGYSIQTNNSRAGNVTTESWGISTPPIPIGPFTLTLGYNYLRYYSDETSIVNVIGTLNASSTNGKNPDSWSFDSYALLDPDQSGGVVKNNDPEKSVGGSFPSYDAYNVTAQGLGGSMQPYIFDNGTLFRQNLKKQGNNGYIIKFNGTYGNNSTSYGFYRPVGFRFKNDFSNSYSYESAAMRVNSNGSLTFNASNTLTPSEGINYTTSQVAGSRHIEYFTNQQIKDGVAKAKGFLDHSPSALREVSKYGYNVAGQVGGFMITNESGVTYHYSLPVYAYYQVQKTFKTGKETQIFQKNSENHPYAYTWFLTAVTGPDYINRNQLNDGTISTQDWGYWVKMTYAQQSDKYIWRNPDVGTHKELDREVEMYSYGQKELYYTDRIETASHVAVFNKSERVDGRGVTSGISGGYNPVSGSNCYIDPNCIPTECTDPDPRVCGDPCEVCQTTISYAVKTLKLDKILLLSRSQYESGGDMVPKSSRVIAFNTDYSLTPGTTNSFNDSNVNLKFGKLTLNSLSFLGKGGSDLIPPLRFSYAKNPFFSKDAYDVWGHYKADYSPTGNENLDRMVSKSSSLDVDAWSLSRITTSLGSGISIVYQGDSYLKPILYRSNLLNIKNVSPNSVYGSVRIEFHNPVDLRKVINLDDDLSLMGVVAYPFYTSDAFGFSCDGQIIGNYGEDYKSIFYQNIRGISKVEENYIDLNFEDLYNDVVKVQGIHGRPVVLPYPKNNTSQPCFDFYGRETNLTVTFANNPKWISGNLSFAGNSSAPINGGGLKVISLVIESAGQTRTTRYNYSNGNTSFEPMGSDIHILQNIEDIVNFRGKPWQAILTKRETKIEEFLTNLNKSFSKLLSISREVPAPGVIYQTVTVEEEILNEGETIPIKIPGKKVFEFQTFDEAFIKRLGISSSQGPYVSQCFDASGNLTDCNAFDPSLGLPVPVTCKDQFGNPIACDAGTSTIYTPLTLKDYSAWVGSLKKVTTYGADNQILNETKTHYLHDEKTTDQFSSDLKTKFRNQGVISQLFSEYRVVDNVPKPLLSRRDEYPLVPIGQTSKDFKSGITNTTENLAFDFYTGNPTKVLSTDGYGDTYVAETLPAYTIPEYSGMATQQVSAEVPGMGLKVKNPKNKNMLTQSAANYVYKVNSDYKTNPVDANKLALVSASVQTWSDQSDVLGVGNGGPDKQVGIWRMKSSFRFIGGDQNVALAANSDGLQPMVSFAPFSNWSSHQEQTGWEKNAEITLYDYFSHALEAFDINGKYAATIMSQDQTRVIGTAANAQYDQIGYSGAEEQPKIGSFVSQYELGNNIYLATSNGASWVQEKAHTGVTSLRAAPGQQAFLFSTGNSQCNTYRASVWSSQPDGKIKYHVDGGVAQTPLVKNTGRAGDWYLLEADISGVSGYDNVRIWCEGGSASQTYFDDFRIHPYQAAMTSYVYNNWGELTHILDNNNLYTEYKYDGMGRLTERYKESFQANTQGRSKISWIDYGYGKGFSQMINLKINKLGPTGSISHDGNVAVLLSGEQTFSFYETCPNSIALQSIIVDGKSYLPNFASGNITLPSGTRMVIMPQSYLVDQNLYRYTSLTLSNITAQHRITGNYGAANQQEPYERYDCEIISGCKTGNVLRTSYDACGMILSRDPMPPGTNGIYCTNDPNSGCTEY